MFEMDHVALQTSDVPGTASYYVRELGAQVLYQDESWAFLRIGQGKLALVRPEQHPAHVAYRVDDTTLQRVASQHQQTITTHRDGTRGIYLTDPAGNTIELICYPKER